MKCLYCGKGIGPIRQLRDVEFCSEPHRTQFRERYRKTLYEALAPEPGPSRFADFIERPAASLGPALIAAPRIPAKSDPLVRTGLAVDPIPGVDRPGWALEQTPALLPARLAWQESPSAVPPATLTAAMISGILPPSASTAEAAPANLAAVGSVARPTAVLCLSAPITSVFTPAHLPPAARTNAPCSAGRLSPELVAAIPASAAPALAGRTVPAAIQVPSCAAMPEAAPAGPLATADLYAPRLLVATPEPAGLVAVGPVASAKLPVTALSCSGTITRPAAPIRAESALPAGFQPAMVAAQPRPLEAGPLQLCHELQTTVNHGVPVALEGQRSRDLAIFLPKPPAVASTPGLGASHRAQLDLHRIAGVTGNVRPALPPIECGFPASAHVDPAAHEPLSLAPLAAVPEPLPARLPKAAPVWQAPQTLATSPGVEPFGNLASPQPGCSTAAIGALAGASVNAGNMHAAGGSRVPRPAAAPPAHAAPLRQIAPALPVAPPGAIASAPPISDSVPAASAPTAAVPAWNDSRAIAPEHPLVPLAGIALPRIECLPALAEAITGPDRALPPAAARSLRSSAVLWTLRIVHLCNPPFSLEPIRTKFNDLIRLERSLHYTPDPADKRAAKSKVVPFKRQFAPESKPKWHYIGMAAAALLLAGVLTPKMSTKGVKISAPWRDVSFRQWISNRATRNFGDDFRAGLNQWKGVQTKWPKSWSYSTDGFMHPGQLALYRPSVPLSDYRFEFMAQVENKSVDWVVRAKDANNYYAVKFTVLQAGPRPTVAMVRYPVIDGNKGQRVLTPLRMMIHANTPYRVTVDVKGNHYRTYVEGQEADFWTEDRLKTGGVGFFSEAGERARVYWVKLESHGDILGRICGLLSGKDGGDGDKEKQAMSYRHAGTLELNGSGLNGESAASTAQEARISRVLSKAASLHLDGKLDEAAKELVRVVDGGERHPALYFALGQLQYEMQEYGPAAASYAQTALLQPLHPTAHFNAGVCQGRIERWEEAAASFRKAISNDPARSEAHLALGACLVQLGLHAEALDAYDHFLEHHPEHDEALFGKAVALQKRDRGSEAVELYKRILNRNPHSEEALSNLVSLSLANQDYEQVRKYAQRLHEAQPKSQIALEGLAGAAFAAGDHQSAADYSRKLAELAPHVFENWFNLGVACHKAGDLGNAADAYARATRVQPDSPQAHLNHGVALQEQGDLKAARQAYERALAIDSNLAGVQWNLGLVHEQLGDTAAAEKLYAQVPANSPDSDDAAFRIGHLRLQRADYTGSIEAFESCLLKRPNWPEARLNLGIAHWRAGDKERARTCFQELTASGTESKEALRGLAALSLEHQEYDKAFEIYRQLLDSGERSPELLYNAGLICQRRGEPEDACVLYREALKADPQFGEALLNLGHALMSLGNEFEARSCWRKAVIAKPELAQRYFEPAAVA